MDNDKGFKELTFGNKNETIPKCCQQCVYGFEILYSAIKE